MRSSRRPPSRATPKTGSIGQPHPVSRTFSRPTKRSLRWDGRWTSGCPPPLRHQVRWTSVSWHRANRRANRNCPPDEGNRLAWRWIRPRFSGSVSFRCSRNRNKAFCRSLHPLCIPPGASPVPLPPIPLFSTRLSLSGFRGIEEIHWLFSHLLSTALRPVLSAPPFPVSALTPVSPPFPPLRQSITGIKPIWKTQMEKDRIGIAPADAFP